LGLTEDEILENERLWMEENQSGTRPSEDSEPGLGSVGVRGFDIDSNPDIPTGDELDAGETETGDSPISGSENVTEPAGGTPNAQ